MKSLELAMRFLHQIRIDDVETGRWLRPTIGDAVP
jgi:hypothetical protein